MTKRLISTIITIIMLLTFNPLLPTQASTTMITGVHVQMVIPTDSSYFKYKSVSENGVEITGYTGTDVNVVIPSVIDGKNVVSIGEWAFMDCSSITEVIIPESVVEIKAQAFFQCSSLINIIIPESVQIIGDDAFFGCTELVIMTVKNPDTIFPKIKQIDFWGNSFFLDGIPLNTLLIGYAGSTTEEYANETGNSFEVHKEVDESAQDALSRFNRGEDVLISQIFEDSKLADYFASWINLNVESTVNKSQLVSKIQSLVTPENYYGFSFNASNLGIKSLKGMEIFGDISSIYRHVTRIYKNGKPTEASYVNIAPNFNFSGNELTNINGLELLTAVSQIDLSNNNITDITGFNNLKTVSGPLVPSHNWWDNLALNLQNNNLSNVDALTNLEVVKGELNISFNALINANGLSNLTSVGTLNLESNLLSDANFFKSLPENALRCIRINNNFINNIEYVIPSSFEGNASSKLSPQYVYTFVQGWDPTVTAEYREKDTEKLLGFKLYENVPYSPIYYQNSPQYYYSGYVEGYKGVEPTVQKFTLLEPTFNSKITAQFGEKQYGGPFTGIINDQSNVTCTSDDPSIVAFDDETKKLKALKEGSTTINIYDNGIFRGSYPIYVRSLTNNIITFYYEKVVLKNIYVHYKYSDGSVALPDKIIPNNVNNKTLTEYAPEIEGYVVDSESKSIFLNNTTQDYEITFIYTKKPIEILKYQLYVQALQTDMLPIPLINAITLVNPYGIKEYTEVSNISVKAMSDSTYKFVKWGLRERLNHTDVWGEEKIYIGDELPLTLNKDIMVSAYFDILSPVKPLDVNSDGVINIKDLEFIAKSYNMKSEDNLYNKYLDINGDKIIDIFDLVLISKEIENQSEIGNLGGNIMNGGFIVQKDGWIYYRNTLDGDKLYKIKVDGTNNIKLSEDSSVYNLNVSNGWIYYRTGYGSLLKIRIDGKERTILTPIFKDYVNIVDDQFYYIQDMKIYKSNEDETLKVKLNNHDVSSLTVSGEWVYYTSWSCNNEIFKVRTNGDWSTTQCISEDISRYMINVSEDWVYYVNKSDGDKIYKVKTDGTAKVKLNDDATGSFNVLGDWVYYSNASDDNKLYKLKIDGTNKLKLNDDYSTSINVDEDFIYYINNIDNKMYRIKCDGSDKKLFGNI